MTLRQGWAFGFVGHIRDKLDIRGPDHLLLGLKKYSKQKYEAIYKKYDFKVIFMMNWKISGFSA
jgi:hypothetical protein